jgi:ABC-2 type transport system ATP-binding protein
VIEVRGLTKRFGDIVAVDDLSFNVVPGKVTGFLGPNGSGKSTTMSMIMGLNHPNSGSVTISGKKYKDLRWPMREVGGLLEARAIHPGRSAYAHLWSLAQYGGITKARVEEVIELVGLTSVAKRRVGKFSLGMGQRLGIAAALLGDPAVVLLDEPVNGLDPEGIRWTRSLCRDLAAEGRTVLISSHLMAEMALTADQLVVIGKGHLIAELSVDEFVACSSKQSFKVRAANLDLLVPALEDAGALTLRESTSCLTVMNLSAEVIGELALEQQNAVYELTDLCSLEDAFMELTEGAVQYRASL